MSIVGGQVVAAGLFLKREGLGRSAVVSVSVGLEIAIRACLMVSAGVAPRQDLDP